MKSTTKEKQYKRPWETMTPDIKTEAIRLTAVTYGVDPRAVFEWFKEYVVKFGDGPDTFVPWYMQQRLRWENRYLPFEPYYPHEVYSCLADAEPADWLYNHPAWAKKTIAHRF